MILSDKVKGYLNEPDRINILSTSNKKGETDVAIFGTPKLSEKKQVTMVLQDNSRSYANLMENPNASCLVLVPGKSGNFMSGCRLYLKLGQKEISKNPVFLEERKKGDKTEWEKGFNVMLEEEEEKRSFPDRHLILFDVVEARPIVDRGQGI